MVCTLLHCKHERCLVGRSGKHERCLVVAGGLFLGEGFFKLCDAFFEGLDAFCGAAVEEFEGGEEECVGLILLRPEAIGIETEEGPDGFLEFDEGFGEEASFFEDFEVVDIDFDDFA